jgi:hypothetical protein
MTADDASQLRQMRGSLVGSLILLTFDAALSGSFLMSILVCPVWFLVSLARNLIRRPGWKVALSRIMLPAVTLGLVLANSSLQSSIAAANAQRIIDACEQFRVANGTYPSKLDELVPRHLASVPRAKYSLALGEFRYWKYKEDSSLMWVAIPPYGRRIYSFERRRWNYVD